MSKQHFSVERMLSLVSFKWHKFGSLAGNLMVCNRCLPIVVPHGINFMVQTGDDMFFGHVHLDNSGLYKTGMPCVHRAKCANCERRGQCWNLEVRAQTLEYVHDHERRAQHIEFPGEFEVTLMGKRGRIVQCMGHDEQRPWISLYTIKFEDGTRFEAYRWQFQVVKS